MAFNSFRKLLTFIYVPYFLERYATGNNRNIDTHEDVKHTMDQRSEQRRRFEQNGNKNEIYILRHETRKEGLEYYIITGHVDGKKDIGKQSRTYLVNLSKWTVDKCLREITKMQI